MRLYKLIMIIETDYYAMSGHGRKDSQTSRRQSPALRPFRCLRIKYKKFDRQDRQLYERSE